MAQARIDYLYVANWSLWTDVNPTRALADAFLARHARALLPRRGVLALGVLACWLLAKTTRLIPLADTRYRLHKIAEYQGTVRDVALTVATLGDAGVARGDRGGALGGLLRARGCARGDPAVRGGRRGRVHDDRQGPARRPRDDAAERAHRLRGGGRRLRGLDARAPGAPAPRRCCSRCAC